MSDVERRLLPEYAEDFMGDEEIQRLVQEKQDALTDFQHEQYQARKDLSTRLFDLDKLMMQRVSKLKWERYKEEHHIHETL